MTEKKAYRVIAPYLTCRIEGQLVPSARASAATMLGFYKGGLLPVNAVAADVERHLAAGRIEEVPDA